FLRAAALPAPPPRAGLVRWDVAALEQAATGLDDHALFLVRDLPELPEPLRQGIRQAAQEGLAAGLRGAVARAQLPAESGRDLVPALEAARAAHPVLLRLVGGLRAAGAAADAAALAEAVAQPSQRLLDSAWLLLDAGSAYQPPVAAQLGWAEGKLDLAALYALSDAALLPGLLARERERLQRLAGLAAPVLATLSAPDLGAAGALPLAARWRGVAEELQRHAQGRPGTLAALERLVAQDLPALTPAACADLAARNGGDWFAEQAARLRTRVRALCRREAEARGTGAWDSLGESFGRLLAGRWPFAPLSAAERGPYATVQQVAEFYADFDNKAAATLAALPADPTLAAEMRRVIEQLRQARAFLRPLAGLEGAEPGLTLTPQFRLLPEQEQGGDAIIEWRLAGRAATTSSMGPPRPVPWRIGDPLTLSLRWARNAPLQPVQVLPGGPRAEAGLVTIAARDPWALVTLARRLAPMAGDWQATPGDPGPVLAIEVQTAESGTAAGSAPISTVAEPSETIPGPPGTQPGSRQGAVWLVSVAAGML
ncbi:hypothetical protein, partial [Paracraurococcus ruber]